MPQVSFCRNVLPARCFCFMESLPPAQLRALLPKVMSVIRSRKASLLAELESMGGQAPTTADFPEPSRAELECEANAAALQQLIRRVQSQWKKERATLKAVVAGARAAKIEEQGSQKRGKKRPSTPCGGEDAQTETPSRDLRVTESPPAGDRDGDSSADTGVGCDEQSERPHFEARCNVSGSRIFIGKLGKPQHKTKNKAKFAFLEGRLPQDVLTLLQSDPELPRTATDMKKRYKYDRATDTAKAKSSGKKLQLMGNAGGGRAQGANGLDTSRPAPAMLAAFAKAVKTVNRGALRELCRLLKQAMSAYSDQELGENGRAAPRFVCGGFLRSGVRPRHAASDGAGATPRRR